MGLLRSLAMLLLLMRFFWLPEVSAQQSASDLDALLQDYAYRAFVRPRTGIPYDAVVPSNLTGIKIAAMRLRSGSLRSRGVVMYKEFEIPIGVTEHPYVERLVLVYQNLGNLSMTYYPLPGYSYAAPIVGLLAYDALNLSAVNLPVLDILASQRPIKINFPDVKLVPGAKCVYFDLHGLVNFSNVLSGNVCLTARQGHFAIVVESPAPLAPPPGGGGRMPPPPSVRPGGGGKNNSKVWIIVGSVLGGLLLAVLLGSLAFWVQKYKNRKKMEEMEKAAEVGEALQMTSVGSTKAPTAMFTRTQPVLETEYAP